MSLENSFTSWLLDRLNEVDFNIDEVEYSDLADFLHDSFFNGLFGDVDYFWDVAMQFDFMHFVCSYC
ncbi:MAG: hypothetical protein ACRC62_31680 [Microcoleus sp.]